MSKESISDNKRIAKNTIFLYLRMFVLMAISLFTSREILRILGVEDFGIYNIVGGVVVLFSFLRSALLRSSQRFMSYEVGIGDGSKIRKTFTMSINVDFCLALIVVFLSETVGLWFVNTHLNIPEGRMLAANIVYQFSIITFALEMMIIPFNSTIIAYEKMSFYAYISIIEAILKLVIVYMLTVITYDKLSIYGALMSFVSLGMLTSYVFYCRKTFMTCRYIKYWDKQYFKEMMNFSGYSMVTGIANISAQQGGNILLNMFVGVIANASFGVANQVSHAINRFASNFQVAFNPQITKLYAVQDNEKLYQLIYRASLTSYYLMLVLSVPFIFKMNEILDLWLEKVPTYAAGFCILMILYELIDSLQSPLITLVYATGKIKGYTIWLSGLIFLNLPVAFLLFKLGMSVYIVLTIRVLINLITAITRIFYMQKLMDFPTKDYLIHVVFRCLPSTVLTLLLGYVLSGFCEKSILGLLSYIIVVITFSAIIMISIGFSKSDRDSFVGLIRKKLHVQKNN